MDDEGFWGLQQSSDFAVEAEIQVFNWINDACEHEDMHYSSEHIGNWGGYRYFQKALADIGWNFFPVLHVELPDANDGMMLADHAALALKELALFRELAAGREMPFLVDTVTGEIVARCNPAFGWMLSMKKGLKLGFDPQGFFIATVDDDNVQQIAFRSVRFEQRFLAFEDTGKPIEVEYYDADTEQRFVCDMALVKLFENAVDNLDTIMPRLIHMEHRSVDASDYNYVVSALERVCQAAIETGNPVVWC
ncbi:MAG: hypothetical protein ACPG7F_02885 [Aggregatilineales bacterium]